MFPGFGSMEMQFPVSLENKGAVAWREKPIKWLPIPEDLESITVAGGIRSSPGIVLRPLWGPGWLSSGSVNNNRYTSSGEIEMQL